LGILNFIRGNPIGGIWYALIGMFLRGAASSSYMQLQTRRIIEGEPVRRFMVRDPITVPPHITIHQLVDEYVYHHYHELFPVVDETGLRGCIGIAQIKAVPRDKWDQARVFEVMSPPSPENMVEAQLDAVKALKIMQRTGNSRLMVIEDGRLAGLVTLKDLLHLIALKMDLEGQK
jgi:CBS domain-containing protein